MGRSGRAAKSVVVKLHPRRLAKAVVLLVVLTTAPDLLIAAGVSVAAVRLLTSLLRVLAQVLPERKRTETRGDFVREYRWRREARP